MTMGEEAGEELGHFFCFVFSLGFGVLGVWLHGWGGFEKMGRNK